MSPPSDTADREIVLSRVFDAPRDLVFKVWTDTEHKTHWWGPRGFSTTTLSADVRPGGSWRFVMHGPDGRDYPNRSVFVEVVPPERVVLDHLETMHRFRMTIRFDEHFGGTQVVWRMRFETPEECAKVKAFAADANEQNFDRLEAELARS